MPVKSERSYCKKRLYPASCNQRNGRPRIHKERFGRVLFIGRRLDIFDCSHRQAGICRSSEGEPSLEWEKAGPAKTARRKNTRLVVSVEDGTKLARPQIDRRGAV